MQKYKDASYHYRKAVRNDPYLHEAFFRIGETYRTEDRLEAALVNYKKALKLEEANEDYIATIVAVYKMLGRDEEVITYLNWLVNVRPDISAYWLDYILYLFEIANYAEALDVITEALSRCGHYAEFFYLDSAALYHTGKEKEALSIFENALNTDYLRYKILLEIDSTFLNSLQVQRLINIYKP